METIKIVVTPSINFVLRRCSPRSAKLMGFMVAVVSGNLMVTDGAAINFTMNKPVVFLEDGLYTVIGKPKLWKTVDFQYVGPLPVQWDSWAEEVLAGPFSREYEIQVQIDEFNDDKNKLYQTVLKTTDEFVRPEYIYNLPINAPKETKLEKWSLLLHEERNKPIVFLNREYAVGSAIRTYKDLTRYPDRIYTIDATPLQGMLRDE